MCIYIYIYIYIHMYMYIKGDDTTGHLGVTDYPEKLSAAAIHLQVRLYIHIHIPMYIHT
jgi:hypothetical protein